MPVQADPVVTRAQAIFKSSQEVRPFDPAAFDFALDDELSFEVSPPAARTAVPAAPAPAPKAGRRRIMGMTPLQLAILIGLALVFLCIVAGLAIYFFALA